MLYERRISSLGSLVEEARVMDADAGLRVLGRYNGRSCFIFVTRFGSEYTAMIYERKGKPEMAGKMLAVRELGGIEDLKVLLRTAVKGRLTAFAY